MTPKVDVKDVIGLYLYGSRVYGTNTEKSDYDYIAVTKRGESDFQIINTESNCNITVYRDFHFVYLLENHEISALECYFLPGNFRLIDDFKHDLMIDNVKLRHAISAKSSNSWVKCKKKLTVEKDYDPYIAKKSLFHSLRIAMFGKQIAEAGKIYDYSEANSLLAEIMSLPDDWKVLDETFRERRNNILSNFRLNAHKS